MSYSQPSPEMGRAAPPAKESAARTPIRPGEENIEKSDTTTMPCKGDREPALAKQEATERLWPSGPANGYHSPAADTLLFLRDPGKLATKRFTCDQSGAVTSESYGRGYEFQWAQVSIADFDTLAKVLGELGNRPEVFVVSGKIRPEFQKARRIRRLLKDKHYPNGEVKTPATIDDAPSRIVHFDVDDVDVPAGHSWDDPEAMARAVWEGMAQRVPQLAGASFVWQASSSAAMAGKEGKAKFHLWAMVESPLTDPERRRLYNAAGSDPALGGAVQANYTAAPMFAGMPDPLAGSARFGVVRAGRDHIPSYGLPIEAPKAPERTTQQGSGSHQGEWVAPVRSDETSAYGRAVLANACRDILDSDGKRNHTINAKAYQIALWVNGGEIQDREAWDALAQAAIQVTGGNRWEEPLGNGFRDGLASGKASTAPERDRLAAAIKETSQRPQKVIPKHITPARAGGASGVVVCIGLQAALEINDSIGAEVWNLSDWHEIEKLAELPTDKAVILCHDGPIEGSIEFGLTHVWVENLLDRGGKVFVAHRNSPDTPWSDALKAAKPGVDTLDPKQRVGRPVTPAVTPAVLSADEVGEKAAEQIGFFFKTLGHKAQYLLKASLGTGKSHALRAAIKEQIEASEGRDRFLIRVPAHFLADEFVAELKAMGVSAGVWRGTDQQDSNAPGETMCRRLVDLKEVRRAGGTVKDLCGSEKSGAVCPFAGVCGYRNQDLRKVNVVIVAGDVSLSNALPAKVRRPVKTQTVTVVDEDTGEKVKVQQRVPAPADFQGIVLDETTPTALLDGADTPDRVALGFLNSDLMGLAAYADVDLTEVVEDKEAVAAMTRIADLLTAECDAGRETITAAELLKAGVNADMLSRIKNHVWSYRPAFVSDAALVKGSSESIAESLCEKSQLMTVLNRVNRLISALTQGIEDAQRNYTEAAPLAAIRLRRVCGDQGVYVAAECMTRSKLNPAISETPLLVLDATPEPDLLRAWFPRLVELADLRARDGAGVTRAQLVDSHMSYSAIAPKPGSKDYQRQAKNTFRAAMISKLFGNLLGGASSYIAPKASREHIEAELSDLGELLRLGHFGGTRGSNAHNDSRVLVTAGRQAPSVRDAERMAAVIAGKPVIQIAPDDGRVLFEQAPAAILMRDGTGRGVINERHPDPMVEAVRRSITEGELDQAQGRGRAVRRGVDNPLLDIRLSDVASDTPVDVIWTSDDFKALGGYAGVLLASGVWPIGRGRSHFIGKAYSTAARAWAGTDHDAELPIVPDGGVCSAEDSNAPWKTTQGRMERNPSLGFLVANVDDAFLSGAETVDLLGVEVPLVGWHRVSVREGRDGRDAIGSVMVQGNTPAAAYLRAQVLFPGCVVEVEGHQPKVEKIPAGQRRLEQAWGLYGFIPLAAREAARAMPDVWKNHAGAKRDLAALKFESLTPDRTAGTAIERSIWTPFLKSRESDSNFQTTYMTGEYRLKPTPEAPQPRIVPVIVKAETEAEARAVIEAKAGPLAEFEVTYAPSADAVADQPAPEPQAVQMEIELPAMPPVPLSVQLKRIAAILRLKIPKGPPIPNPKIPKGPTHPAIDRLARQVAAIERNLQAASTSLARAGDGLE